VKLRRYSRHTAFAALSAFLLLSPAMVALSETAGATIEPVVSLTTRAEPRRFTFRSILDLNATDNPWWLAYWQRRTTIAAGFDEPPVHVAGFVLGSVSVGPLVLAGELARLLQPLPSPASSAWYRSPSVRIDGSLWPTRRTGVSISAHDVLTASYLRRDKSDTWVATVDTDGLSDSAPVGLTMVAARSTPHTDDGQPPWFGAGLRSSHVAHFAARFIVRGPDGGITAASLWTSIDPILAPGWAALAGVILPITVCRGGTFRVAGVLHSPSYRTADGSTLDGVGQVSVYGVLNGENAVGRLAAVVSIEQPDSPSFIVSLDPSRMTPGSIDLDLAVSPSVGEPVVVPSVTLSAGRWARHAETIDTRHTFCDEVGLSGSLDFDYDENGGPVTMRIHSAVSIDYLDGSLTVDSRLAGTLRWARSANTSITANAVVTRVRARDDSSDRAKWDFTGYLEWTTAAAATPRESASQSGSRWSIPRHQ
jgi:hypothetical protein